MSSPVLRPPDEGRDRRAAESGTGATHQTKHGGSPQPSHSPLALTVFAHRDPLADSAGSCRAVSPHWRVSERPAPEMSERSGLRPHRLDPIRKFRLGISAAGGMRVTSPILMRFAELWEAASERLAQEGAILTLLRVHRETGVPVATLSDWRRGTHEPREADQLFKVVRVLSQWAQLPLPTVREWIPGGDGARERRTVRAVAAPAPGVSSWAPSLVGLGERLAVGFAADQVQIDALCLTGQSLSLAVGRPIQDLYAGKIRPKRIDVRVLMPSRDIDLAFPAPVEPTGDAAVQSQWLAERNTHAQSLRGVLHSLRTTHNIAASVEFRVVPFTPMAEIYMINGAEALFAYCTVSRREEDIGGNYTSTYGTRPEFNHQRRFGQESKEDVTFVEQSCLWFQAIWSTISAEMRLI